MLPSPSSVPNVAAGPRLQIMVLAGGPDHERAVSLKSGASVAQALQDAGHTVVLTDLLPSDLSPLKRFHDAGMDALFPTLHGPWGEGGALQDILEAHKIPYVGCAPEAAKRAMDKDDAKRRFAQAGLATPDSEVVPREQHTSSVSVPCVVKPVDEGSSIHLTICREAEQIGPALAAGFQDHDRMLVESFVQGREITVGVLGTGEDAFALPPIEIRPADGAYDYNAKYERNDTQYLFGSLSNVAVKRLQKAALTAHRTLGCRDLSRSDFILTDADEPYILETNTMPGFTDHSLLPKSAAEHGWPMVELCHQLVTWAVERVK